MRPYRQQALDSMRRKCQTRQRLAGDAAPSFHLEPFFSYSWPLLGTKVLRLPERGTDIAFYPAGISLLTQEACTALVGHRPETQASGDIYERSRRTVAGECVEV